MALLPSADMMSLLLLPVTRPSGFRCLTTSQHLKRSSCPTQDISIEKWSTPNLSFPCTEAGFFLQFHQHRLCAILRTAAPSPAPPSVCGADSHAGTIQRTAPMRYVFADCVLDTALATLHRSGRTIPLRPKVFHLLQYLLEQRAHLVTKDVLCAQVWPGQYISDTALEGCIKLARHAIGDSGREQRLIQTRRGYGYRFVGAVEEQAVGHTERRGTAPGDSLAPPVMSSPEPAPGREALA